MKIFWSWQSDTPGKTGRFLVRDALLGAIADIKEEAATFEEPTSRAEREALHLDSDRQGVPGSPDLAATIFTKIDASTVVIADVTPVGKGITRHNAEKRLPRRALMNPNVAIELGYALGRHTQGSTNNLLMVFNEYYGSRADLPFDLMHKAGPIFYKIAPDAEKSEIDAAIKRLRIEFVLSLRPFISAGIREHVLDVFEAASPGQNIGVFFNEGDAIGRKPGYAHLPETVYIIKPSPIFYLRLKPKHPLSAPLTRTDLNEIVHHLPFFDNTQGSFQLDNRWGCASVLQDGNSGSASAVAQIFFSGEIWAVSAKTVVTIDNAKYLLIGRVEMILRKRLEAYLVFMRDRLGVEGPIEVEVGFVGVAGSKLLLNQRHTGDDVFSDPPPIKVVDRGAEAGTVTATLLEIFDAIFMGLVNDRRPDNYNGFPDPNRPPSYPEHGYW